MFAANKLMFKAVKDGQLQLVSCCLRKGDGCRKVAVEGRDHGTCICKNAILAFNILMQGD